MSAFLSIAQRFTVSLSISRLPRLQFNVHASFFCGFCELIQIEPLIRVDFQITVVEMCDNEIENLSHWDVVDPLPSYGRGLEVPGKRYRSLISGQNLTDVVITSRDDISCLLFWFLSMYFHTHGISSHFLYMQ